LKGEAELFRHRNSLVSYHHHSVTPLYNFREEEFDAFYVREPVLASQYRMTEEINSRSSIHCPFVGGSFCCEELCFSLDRNSTSRAGIQPQSLTCSILHRILVLCSSLRH